jgi:[ribosomal protein S18]-alanine N-acetyltransferase
VTLRPATESDVPALSALEEQLFGVDAWSPAVLASELTGPGRAAVVAVSDDEVVGYAVTMASGDVVDLQRIAVHPAHRRAGLARALLAELLTGASADGMLLEVSADNEGALAFYASEGFSQIDRRRRYYRDGSDAVVMRLPLGPACGGRAR